MGLSSTKNKRRQISKELEAKYKSKGVKAKLQETSRVANFPHGVVLRRVTKLVVSMDLQVKIGPFIGVRKTSDKGFHLQTGCQIPTPGTAKSRHSVGVDQVGDGKLKTMVLYEGNNKHDNPIIVD